MAVPVPHPVPHRGRAQGAHEQDRRRGRRLLRLIWLAPLLAGCQGGGCIVPESEWKRSTPQETFALFQKAAECDDVDAAYETLSSHSRHGLSKSDFIDAWSYAGDTIRALRFTAIASLEDDPTQGPTAKKATFRHGNHLVSLPMVQEGGLWLFVYPTPYHSEEELRATLDAIEDEAAP